MQVELDQSLFECRIVRRMNQVRAPARPDSSELALDSNDIGLDVGWREARGAVEREELGARHGEHQLRTRDAVGHRPAHVRKTHPVGLEKFGRPEPLWIDRRQRRHWRIGSVEHVDRIAEGDGEGAGRGAPQHVDPFAAPPRGGDERFRRGIQIGTIPAVFPVMPLRNAVLDSVDGHHRRAPGTAGASNASNASNTTRCDQRVRAAAARVESRLQ